MEVSGPEPGRKRVRSVLVPDRIEAPLVHQGEGRAQDRVVAAKRALVQTRYRGLNERALR